MICDAFDSLLINVSWVLEYHFVKTGHQPMFATVV